jgi:hypothetical protein
MPIWIAALIGGLVQSAFSMVGRVLVALGFSYVTFSGLDTSLSWIKTTIQSSVTGLPSQALSVLGACNVGIAVSIVLSAISARMIFDGMTGGAIRKMVLK